MGKMNVFGEFLTEEEEEYLYRNHIHIKNSRNFDKKLLRNNNNNDNNNFPPHRRSPSNKVFRADKPTGRRCVAWSKDTSWLVFVESKYNNKHHRVVSECFLWNRHSHVKLDLPNLDHPYSDMSLFFKCVLYCFNETDDGDPRVFWVIFCLKNQCYYLSCFPSDQEWRKREALYKWKERMLYTDIVSLHYCCTKSGQTKKLLAVTDCGVLVTESTCPTTHKLVPNKGPITYERKLVNYCDTTIFLLQRQASSTWEVWKMDLSREVTYPDMMEFFETLGVDMEASDTSFSVSLEQGQGCEWGTRNGLSSLFAQKTNALSPWFWKTMKEITSFKDDAISYLQELDHNPDIDHSKTLGSFIKSRGYSKLFQKYYLIPVCSSICPSSSGGVTSFSAYSVLSYLRSHNLFQVSGGSQLNTLRWHSQQYINKVKDELESRGCQIRTSSEVYSVSTVDEGCLITCEGGSEEIFSGCIIATHPPEALNMLGKQATYDEQRILGAFQYAYSDMVLHRDNKLMPKSQAAWSSRNFVQTVNKKACVTYWLDMLQNTSETSLPLLLTLNAPFITEGTLFKWSIGQPIPTIAASKASSEINHIQGKRNIWFSGAYEGFGLHEDRVKAGILAANCFLRKISVVQNNHKHMVHSWLERGAHLVVTRFLSQFIATGSLTLIEEGGTTFTFAGTKGNSTLKVCLRVHSPQFYWKIAAESDLGIAEAYFHGDFSFVDKDEGLVNLFMLYIANMELSTYNSRLNSKRGWWTPLLFTSIFGTGKYYLKHVWRQNTLTQARRNISQHYDLSNELFSLFLDETMSYSCAIFKAPGEDLKSAQLRKIQAFIDKAKIDKHQHVLEIGFGWGALAIETVKQTGCKYTGITLSEKQLQYAEVKVKEAGLEDHIEFILCDYRELPKTFKYDRILSCEVLESVGHEYMEEFFRCCDSVLAENGLIVIQTSVITDEKYDEYRRSQGFITEYIFLGACMPSVSRITSAMAASSRLCVVHLEDIGRHYYKTLRLWRKSLLKNRSQILALGFDERFIRIFEYYFDYCASGYKMCILGNIQMVFTRPGDVAVFGDAYDSLVYSE